MTTCAFLINLIALLMAFLNRETNEIYRAEDRGRLFFLYILFLKFRQISGI